MINSDDIVKMLQERHAVLLERSGEDNHMGRMSHIRATEIEYVLRDIEALDSDAEIEPLGIG